MEAFCYAKHMAGKLIIIRGNSGSGKSTIATMLRAEMGYGTMLIPQDIIRREIMRVPDDAGNPTVKLISDIAYYGKNIGYDVIIEGILAKNKYGHMLEELSKEFDKVHAYYLDLSFGETLKRHNSKEKKNEFGANEMAGWWLENDYLGIENEHKIYPEVSTEDAVKMILSHIEE